MVSHYHVCTGQADAMPISDVLYDEYEESITTFVGLANSLFKELRGSEYDLTIGQALEATDHGKGRGAFVGPPSLVLYWLRCEDVEHDTPAWN